MTTRSDCRRALAVGAHPDDIEFAMSGTLMLLQRAGYEIHVLHLANGSCGSLDLPAAEIARLRSAEAASAAALIGAVYHPPLVNDIDIMYEPHLLARVGALMRDIAPDVLLVPSPQDYMEDHEIACRLAVSAAFCRGMPNYPTIPTRPAIDRPVTVYHAQPHGNRDPLGQLVQPAVFVDIGAVMDRKREMLNCHQSQKQWLDQSQGMDSYLQTMEAFGLEVGTLSGRFRVAEGFRRRLHYGFCDAGSDPLRILDAAYYAGD